MTEEQYRAYKIINNEIENLKSFLMWCGKKYRNNSLGKFPFKISIKRKKFALIRTSYGSSIPDSTYEIPIELRKRIIETIENYVDEKEQQLQEI